MRFNKLIAASLLSAAALVATPAMAQNWSATGELTDSDAVSTTSSPRHDDYRIQLSAGKRYAITAQSDAFDTVISLYRSTSAEPLATNDDSGDTLNSRIVFSPTQSGTYTLRVTSYSDDGRGAYTAAVEELPPLPAPITTPTGTETTEWSVFAGELTDSDPTDGGHYKDYAVTLTAGQPAIISLSSDAFDALVKVYSERDADPVASDDDTGGNLNSLLVFTPETDGTYYIRVTSFDAGSTGAYTLRITK